MVSFSLDVSQRVDDPPDGGEWLPMAGSVNHQTTVREPSGVDDRPGCQLDLVQLGVKVERAANPHRRFVRPPGVPKPRCKLATRVSHKFDRRCVTRVDIGLD